MKRWMRMAAVLLCLLLPVAAQAALVDGGILAQVAGPRDGDTLPMMTQEGKAFTLVLPEGTAPDFAPEEGLLLHIAVAQSGGTTITASAVSPLWLVAEGTVQLDGTMAALIYNGTGERQAAIRLPDGAVIERNVGIRFLAKAVEGMAYEDELEATEVEVLARADGVLAEYGGGGLVLRLPEGRGLLEMALAEDAVIWSGGVAVVPGDSAIVLYRKLDGGGMECAGLLRGNG